jgi:hypothetical protein
MEANLAVPELLVVQAAVKALGLWALHLYAVESLARLASEAQDHKRVHSHLPVHTPLELRTPLVRYLDLVSQFCPMFYP